jgi:hypothetical protein
VSAQDRIEVKKAGTKFFLGNVEVTEAEYRKVYPPPRDDGPGAGSFVTFKPMASRALKVNPSQIAEAKDVAKAKGVPTEFTDDGRPVFTSSRHFREYAKRHGFVHMGYALLAAVLFAAATAAQPCEIPRPLPQPPGETAEPPRAVGRLPADLAAGDDRLFDRIRDRIDRRVDERMAEAVEEAADDGPNKKVGAGTLLAAAVVRLVRKCVELLIVAVVLSAVKALLGTYAIWLALGFVIAVAVVAYPVGWLGGRRGGSARGS